MIRDRALILFGFASALRSSKFPALRLRDVIARPGGLLVVVRRSRTHPDARGQVVGVAHGGTPEPTRSPPLPPGPRSARAGPGALFT